MAKINNRGIYGNISNPSLLDFLLGTKEEDGSTKSFPLQSIIQLINGVNGKNNIQYQFSDGSDPDIDYASSGTFFTNNNNTSLPNFTELIFNKENLQSIDLSLLFNKIAESNDIVIRIEHPENPNIFFNLKVISFVDNTEYFVFGVQPFKDFYLGSLENEKIYSLYFDLQVISEEEKADKIIKSGNINISGLTISILENDFQWRINQQDFLNTPELINFPIPPAADGFYRSDILVGTSNNDYQLIQGTPDSSASVEPQAPINTIRIAGISLFGAIIGQPTPTPTSDFMQKSERDSVILVGSGVINQLDLVDEKATIVFKGAITRLNTISYAQIPYKNKTIRLTNLQSTPVTIGHSVSGYGVDFIFSDEQDYILKPNETIEFSFDITYAPYAHHMLIGSKGIATWSELQGKPSTFPPSAHTHTVSQITDFPTFKTIENQSIVGAGNIDLNKSDVGLSNVDNTSDLNKPISTATQTALNGKEPIIPTGTALQYIKGDKTLGTFPTVDQTIIQNSTNAVSGNAVFDGLALKANLASPALTGTPTAPTATAGTNTTQVATTAFVLANMNANAVLLTGNQNITGQKSFNVSNNGGILLAGINTPASGLFINGIGSGTNGIKISGIGNASDGIYIDNNSGNNGRGIVINNTTGTGDPFRYQKNAVNKVVINDTGDLTSTSFIKSGGTSSQFLKADGSVDSNSYALASSTHNPVTIGTANGLSLSTQQLSLSLASSGVTGALSGTDWNTFNGKFNTPTGLTTNYLPKWNGSGFGNSNIFDNGTNVGIGTSSPIAKIDIAANANGSGLGLRVNTNTRAIGEDYIWFGDSTVPDFLVNTSGNTLFGKTTDNGVDKVQVNGSGSFSGNLKLGNNSSIYLSGTNASNKIESNNPDQILELNGSLKTIFKTFNGAAWVERVSINQDGTITASPAVSPNQVVIKSQLDAVASSGTYTPSNQTNAAQTVNFIRSYWKKNGNVLTVTTSLTYTVTQIQSSSSFHITLPNGFLVSGASNGRIIGSSLLHTQGIFNNNANMKAYEASDSSKINLQANFQASVSSGTYETTIIYTVLIQ